MAKKTQGINRTWIIAIVIIVALIFASNQGWLEKFSIGTTGSSGTLTSGGSSGSSGGGSSTPPTATSYISLSVYPGEACLGDSVTGTISSNLPSAVCYLQVKIGSFPWMNVGDSFILDQQGKYSATTTANTAGSAVFRVACGNVLSNQRIITVSACASDNPDSSSSYTCGVTSYCMAGTCPTGYTCQELSYTGITWCGCINGEEVHPDWKVGGVYFNPN